MLRIPLLRLIALAGLIGLTACGEDEEAILIANLQEDLGTASAIIDSLQYTVESSSQLITDLRTRADSLEQIDDFPLEFRIAFSQPRDRQPYIFEG